MTTTILTTAMVLAVAVIAVGAILGVLVVARADDDASRAVGADLLFFSAIAIFVPIASLTGSAVVFDVALIATVLGILATLALAFMLTRGRR